MAVQTPKELLMSTGVRVTVAHAGPGEVEDRLGESRDRCRFLLSRHPAPALDLEPLDLRRRIQAERRWLHATDYSGPDTTTPRYVDRRISIALTRVHGRAAM
jgi:hypothetical protein